MGIFWLRVVEFQRKPVLHSLIAQLELNGLWSSGPTPSLLSTKPGVLSTKPGVLSTKPGVLFNIPLIHTSGSVSHPLRHYTSIQHKRGSLKT